MKTELSGKVLVVGNNIDTDMIYPGRFLELTDPKEIGSHCLAGISEDIGPNFPQGGILVAGTNFGCGSSREHAPIALINMGASAVLADSFARIFFRNALNIGLPILECEEAAQNIKPGDTVSVDFNTGVITNETSGQTFQAEPFPPFMQNLIACGGLVNYSKSKIGK